MSTLDMEELILCSFLPWTVLVPPRLLVPHWL